MSLRYPLFVADAPGYTARLEVLAVRFSAFRPAEGYVWRTRIASWLSNFSGPVDQLRALSMLERTWVLTHHEIVNGCDTVRAQLEAAFPDATRFLHFAHTSSGQELLRLMEKELRVQDYFFLRPAEFTRISSLEKLDGAVVTGWDRFNGTGRELGRNSIKYSKIFQKTSIKSLNFAYLSGKSDMSNYKIPKNVKLFFAYSNFPITTPEEADLCQRYASLTGDQVDTRHETGALLVFPDNPPNNASLVLRAKGNDRWSPLFERRETRKRGPAPRPTRRS